jgi:hypothetical protein
MKRAIQNAMSPGISTINAPERKIKDVAILLYKEYFLVRASNERSDKWFFAFPI